MPKWLRYRKFTTNRKWNYWTIVNIILSGILYLIVSMFIWNTLIGNGIIATIGHVCTMFWLGYVSTYIEIITENTLE